MRLSGFGSSCTAELLHGQNIDDNVLGSPTNRYYGGDKDVRPFQYDQGIIMPGQKFSIVNFPAGRKPKVKRSLWLNYEESWVFGMH